MNNRYNSKIIKIGNVVIGGGNTILVQSMTNTDTKNVKSTVRQIKQLEQAGCEIVRVAVPDKESALNLGKIKKAINIPLVADIHFDFNLALIAVDQGVDKLRINPGNIGSYENVAKVVKAAKSAKVPIRIGVNAGSLKSVHEYHDKANLIKFRTEKLVDSAMEHIKILESLNFYDIVVSLKASDIATTVESYRLIAKKVNYPLHLGITEAGSIFRGTVKSSAGLAILLYEGLGDTIRISLTANPVEEIKTAYQLLQSLNLRSTGIELISCPTCSRCEVDLIKIVNEIEEKVSGMQKQLSIFKNTPLKVAVMGCVVNGPGEAKDSDLGIAGGKNKGLLFQNGVITGEVKHEEWVKTLIKLILKKCREFKNGR